MSNPCSVSTSASLQTKSTGRSKVSNSANLCYDSLAKAFLMLRAPPSTKSWKCKSKSAMLQASANSRNGLLCKDRQVSRCLKEDRWISQPLNSKTCSHKTICMVSRSKLPLTLVSNVKIASKFQSRAARVANTLLTMGLLKPKWAVIKSSAKFDHLRATGSKDMSTIFHKVYPIVTKLITNISNNWDLAEVEVA